jgi:electron transport complex protein RnfG
VNDLVQIEGAPRPKADPREVSRVATNLVLVCALGALVLGGIFLGTERVARAGRLAGERRAVNELLALPADARVLEVRQFLDSSRGEVVYRVAAWGDERALPREIAFALDGTPRANAGVRPAGAALTPLGRTLVAYAGGALAGFVVEGEARGFKNRIRFFVALDSSFTVRGVRVVEHEEDPGLGAEVATGWFQAQFAGRSAAQVAALDVTKDPMPEDWRAALGSLAGADPIRWRETHAALLAREHARPIYAVTGATISSRALTGGVRTTLEHFRRRWALLSSWLGVPS